MEFFDKQYGVHYNRDMVTFDDTMAYACAGDGKAADRLARSMCAEEFPHVYADDNDRSNDVGEVMAYLGWDVAKVLAGAEAAARSLDRLAKMTADYPY